MAKLSSIKLDLGDTAVIEYESGITVTLRPLPNPDYDAHMANIKKPQLRRIRKGSISGGEVDAMVKDAMAHCVVVGWGNIENEEGEAIPYSPAKCIEFFNDPQLYDFYQFCRGEAADIGNFMKEVEADGLGN